jgi:hypothetical protein
VLNVARYDVFKLGEAVLSVTSSGRCACWMACRPRRSGGAGALDALRDIARRSNSVRDAISAGRHAPMALREARAAGREERLMSGPFTVHRQRRGRPAQAARVATAVKAYAPPQLAH